MAVYVDNFGVPARVGGLNARWSHMIADTKEELHQMAASIGLKREWFQDKHAHLPPDRYPTNTWHYDVTQSKRKLAIQAGAVEVEWDELPTLIEHRMQFGVCRVNS